MLYTLIHSPYACDFEALLRIARLGDDLLMVSDGVIAALVGSSAVCLLTASPLMLYALESDVVARGLIKRCASNIKIINYNDFVCLTEKQPQQIMW
ncbi:sulfur relay protein TusB/DsrH [secondary endosymbiont of Heteropsylla cubana]|uniref:Protein TusB n=1 Tax=secondary endosymbiont of Heteropsylla cubana TaxID=134287 RepID=J3YTF6_9ENTR|nr:sulfurtransferase complex subunit TusB [secondary endosymbiont of Heteropsylla cubana]AFP85738.1 sulfur relay protein TusB/DsrH [secondary endosymbiont of Heteropsylla cubana]